MMGKRFSEGINVKPGFHESLGLFDFSGGSCLRMKSLVGLGYLCPGVL